MLGKNLSLDSLSKGYIQQDEIDFIRSFMWDNEGSILEVGAYVGKTFHGLFQHRPNWDYTAVDTWELYPFPMVDPKLPFDHTLDYPMVHSKYFKENCPFSKYHVESYENILFTNQSFDVIILSAAATKSMLSVFFHYMKAIQEIKSDGIIIGRYLNHEKYGKEVTEALAIIEPDNFINHNGSMFAIW